MKACKKCGNETSRPGRKAGHGLCDECAHAEVAHAIRIDRDDHGVRFLVGDHVVAEWRDDGEGLNGDNVLVETPALKYLETTTAEDRCARIAFAMVHWEVLSALLAGPGDGELRPICQVYGDDDFCEICGRGGDGCDDDRR